MQTHHYSAIRLCEKIRATIEAIAWNFGEFCPPQKIAQDLKDKITQHIPSNLVHLRLTRILNLEGLIDVSITLTQIQTDLKLIVNQDYEKFDKTDYR